MGIYIKIYILTKTICTFKAKGKGMRDKLNLYVNSIYFITFIYLKNKYFLIDNISQIYICRYTYTCR